MPLARLAAREIPEAKFLVVQSRGRWEHALEVLKFKPEDFPNVKVISHQHDMRRVYASTRVLLLPSLWHESGARVIAEAQLNGIPVIASDTGGSAELIGKGGVVLPLPQEVRDRRGEVVATEEHLRPWLAELTRVVRDQRYYEELCRITESEGRKHDIEFSTDRFIRALAQAALSVAGEASTPLARLAAAPHPAGKASAA
jgi:glycosyltransferase involved in cell wall biosynthesis